MELATNKFLIIDFQLNSFEELPLLQPLLRLRCLAAVVHPQERTDANIDNVAGIELQYRFVLEPPFSRVRSLTNGIISQ